MEAGEGDSGDEVLSELSLMGGRGAYLKHKIGNSQERGQTGRRCGGGKGLGQTGPPPVIQSRAQHKINKMNLPACSLATLAKRFAFHCQG